MIFHFAIDLLLSLSPLHKNLHRYHAGQESSGTSWDRAWIMPTNAKLEMDNLLENIIRDEHGSSMAHAHLHSFQLNCKLEMDNLESVGGHVLP